jgi:hypothetical protein
MYIFSEILIETDENFSRWMRIACCGPKQLNHGFIYIALLAIKFIRNGVGRHLKQSRNMLGSNTAIRVYQMSRRYR